MSAVRVEESIEIERPVAEVFAYVSDPTHLPEWTPIVTDVRTEASPPSAAGTRFTVTQKFLGTRWETPCEVVSSDGGRFSYRSVGGPVPYTFTYTCETVPGGTRLTMVGEGEPGNLFRLAGPLFVKAAQRQVKSDLETIRDLLTA